MKGEEVVGDRHGIHGYRQSELTYMYEVGGQRRQGVGVVGSWTGGGKGKDVRVGQGGGTWHLGRRR